MSEKYLIKNATVVNEGEIFEATIAIDNGIIAEIYQLNEEISAEHLDFESVNAKNKLLLPGVIDDQVHFREPGLTHKADIHSESRAAVAGGITSFMEMPNTIPNTLTQDLLEEKYQIASQHSLANYSFYMGASNDNIAELVKTNPGNVCGVKVFMGASTGNMLVDDSLVLEKIFADSPCLVAVHCEHEPTVRQRVIDFMQLYGDNAPPSVHPLIRNAEACYKSSAKAVELATKYNTRLHVLHLSSAMEMKLFDNQKPLRDKKITAEVCLHHLWFSEADYQQKGNLIKWNPAVKSAADREALWDALLSDRLDVVATDHAPHTLEEKMAPYFKSPSGGPMVQHLLTGMLQFWQEGKISLQKVVEKLCHSPAIAFNVHNRGFIRKGYYADLLIVETGKDEIIQRDSLLYKCGWSPMEGYRFSNKVTHTFVNGCLVCENGHILNKPVAMRLLFDR